MLSNLNSNKNSGVYSAESSYRFKSGEFTRIGDYSNPRSPTDINQSFDIGGVQIPKPDINIKISSKNKNKIKKNLEK